MDTNYLVNGHFQVGSMPPRGTCLAVSYQQMGVINRINVYSLFRVRITPLLMIGTPVALKAPAVKVLLVRTCLYQSTGPYRLKIL